MVELRQQHQLLRIPCSVRMEHFSKIYIGMWIYIGRKEIFIANPCFTYIEQFL
jgi:hypothetical protein